MDINLIKSELEELIEMVGMWSEGNTVSEIEQDIAMDIVKRVYHALKSNDITPTQIKSTPEVKIEEEQTKEEPKIEEIIEVADEASPIISIDLEDVTILPEELIEMDKEEAVPQPAKHITEGSLFDLDSIPTHKTSKRSAILSLYSDDVPTIQTHSTEPQHTKPIEIVEDLCSIDGQETTILAQSYTSSSINDRYIIAQNLFEGDMEAYEVMISRLQEIDNFDDCMIYIVENYNWNAEDEATKMVISLLEQRFSIK